MPVKGILVNTVMLIIFLTYLFGCAMSYLQHVESNPLTGDKTWAPCIGSVELYPLDHQASLQILSFLKWISIPNFHVRRPAPFLLFLLIKLCPSLCNPMDYSPPGSSIHGILQATILDWVAISFSWGSS